LTPEQQIQRQILELLKIRHIWHRRLNSGYRGGVSFGSVGMGDILATPRDSMNRPHIWWIEVKAPGGKQSEAQIAFQREVDAEGHTYILADSINAVEEAVKRLL
jgi:hypothetical protein